MRSLYKVINKEKILSIKRKNQVFEINENHFSPVKKLKTT